MGMLSTNTISGVVGCYIGDNIIGSSILRCQSPGQSALIYGEALLPKANIHSIYLYIDHQWFVWLQLV